MKYILIALITLSAITLNAQDKTVTVSSQDAKISVIIGDEENDTKVLTLNVSDAADRGYLNVSIDDRKGDKDWKRNFSIYDSTGNSVKDFMVMKNGVYCIKLSDLKTLLQPQQQYYIYTTAVPVDPQKAMLVKMGRQIICALKIR